MSRHGDVTMRSTRTNESVHYVGFANYPNQYHRRVIMQGIEFTIMVVGMSDLGKSTFINTLFQAEINPEPTVRNDFKRYLRSVAQVIVPPSTTATMKIEEKKVKLIEKGIPLWATLIDTPGFGDNLDNNSKR